MENFYVTKTKIGCRRKKKQDELEDRETLLCSIKMPPKMLKRARLKGAEVTTSSLFAN